MILSHNGDLNYVSHFQKGGCMKARHLAEAIILQSIEDLWDKDSREESIRFFTGEDFRTCAAIAKIDIADQIRILTMLSEQIKKLHKPAKARKKTSARYIFPNYASNKELIRT